MKSLINKQAIRLAMDTCKEVLDKNAPKILAGLGIAFGAGSVIFAVKGTVDSVKIVEAKKAEEPEKEFTKTDVVKCVWKEYIPTACLGAASVACIVGSVHISAQRLAFMAAAYASSENSFKRYKEKAKEFLGERKEEELRGAIHQDAINANPPREDRIIRTSGGNTLCVDSYTGQYFYSDADTICRAINAVNNLLLHDYHATLNDILVELGLETCKLGEKLGWSTVNGELIEPSFTTEITPDNIPVLVLDYIEGPRPDYCRTL